MAAHLFAPLAAPAVTATDQVFEALFDAVVSLRLPPGTKVSETEIAKQLDVSRQPVRDAFFRLSELGFLSIRPQRPTLIKPISKRAVLDALFVRTALEVECLRIVIVEGASDLIVQLRQILARQAHALDDPDPSRFHELDERFHQTLCEHAGYPSAWRLIQEQKAHMDRTRYLTLSEARRKTVLGEHVGIVEALEVENASLAEKRLSAHLGDIRTVLEDLRQAYPDYFEDD